MTQYLPAVWGEEGCAGSKGWRHLHFAEARVVELHGHLGGRCVVAHRDAFLTTKERERLLHERAAAQQPHAPAHQALAVACLRQTQQRRASRVAVGLGPADHQDDRLGAFHWRLQRRTLAQQALHAAGVPLHARTEERAHAYPVRGIESGAALGQELHSAVITSEACTDERRAALDVGGVEARARLDQQQRAAEGPVLAGHVQRCLAVCIGLIDERVALCEQRTHHCLVTVLAGHVERGAVELAPKGRQSWVPPRITNGLHRLRLAEPARLEEAGHLVCLVQACVKGPLCMYVCMYCTVLVTVMALLGLLAVMFHS